MSKTAIRITTNSEIIIETIPEGSDKAEYQYLKSSVGGYIQAVPLEKPVDDLTMWCNEEGKIDGLPFNFVATYLWELSYGKTDLIMGDIVITGGADDEGETLGLTKEQEDKLLSVLK
jgi:hypothetical protein